jgi:hypothetical protein
MMYLVLTLALSFVCALGTWLAYRLFLRFVNTFDQRAIKRWQQEEEEQAGQYADSADDAAADDDFWPEIILADEPLETLDFKRKQPEK